MAELHLSGEYTVFENCIPIIDDPRPGSHLRIQIREAEQPTNCHVGHCQKRFWRNDDKYKLEGWDGAELWEVELTSDRDIIFDAIPSICSPKRIPIAVEKHQVNKKKQVKLTLVRTKMWNWHLLLPDMKIADIVSCIVVSA